MQLKHVVENIPGLAAGAICVAYRSSLEDEPTVRWVNDAFCNTFGFSPEEAIGMPSYDFFHWDYVADFLSAIEQMEVAGQKSISMDSLFLRRDKSSFWGGVSFVAIPDEDGPGRHGILMISDIDELKNREQSAELALIEHEHLLAKLEAIQARLVNSIEMIPDPFAIYDARDRLVIWNPAFARHFVKDPGKLAKGMKKSEILRNAIGAGFIDDAIGQEDAWFEAHMKNWRSDKPTSMVMKMKGQDYKTIRSTAPNGDRVALHVDISEQLRQRNELETYAKKLEKANNEINHQALHDELTGLGNRRYLNLMLEKLIAERELNGGELVALHVDLDRFKQINDTMGHAAGDHVLCEVADILRNCLRKDDVVARTGGDEFVVLLKADQDSSEPEILAERLIAEASKPIPFEDRPCRVGASVGIARTPVIRASELLTSSDVALYKAKQGGRSTLVVFDHADLEDLRANKQLADDILRGLDDEEFVPVYQAQIDPVDDRIVGFEVLARWRHPSRGLLAPGAFLGIASELQLTGNIDGMIFRKAMHECRDAFAALDAYPSLSFNVSLQRMMDPRLDDDLQQQNYLGQIAFELVETVFIDQESHEFLNRINAIRSLGVTFEVDDFGSGRASIVGLRQIEADRLKIDHRLVQPIIASSSARKLVKSIVDIGRALDIEVTAEGIETAEHARIMTELGCSRLQGFHYAKPLPLDGTMQLLTSAQSRFAAAAG